MLFVIAMVAAQSSFNHKTIYPLKLTIIDNHNWQQLSLEIKQNLLYEVSCDVSLLNLKQYNLRIDDNWQS